ncbi:MAG: hypothetical protein L3J07_01335 [Candidatus Magasanikbacteria bacterium]|nr:hypothetical protein [Candidatus Magasanikbacteria bacterium]
MSETTLGSDELCEIDEETIQVIFDCVTKDNKELEEELKNLAFEILKATLAGNMKKIQTTSILCMQRLLEEFEKIQGRSPKRQ